MYERVSSRDRDWSSKNVLLRLSWPLLLICGSIYLVLKSPKGGRHNNNAIIQVLTDMKATKLTLRSYSFPIWHLDEFCLMHLVACVTTKAFYSSVPLHARGEFRFLNPYRDFQKLRTSDFMLKFIYHTIRAFFNRCSCLLQRNH